MHIVFICDPIDKQTAGIYQFTLQVVNHLWIANKKHRLSFITLNSSKILNIIPAIPRPNSLKFLFNDPIRAFVTLPRLINKLNPDIVVEPAHFGPFNLKSSIKRITIIHDLTPILFPQYHPFFSRFLQKVFLPRIIKKADLVITNSCNTSKDVIRFSKIAQNKTHTILLGKDSIFKPDNRKSILLKYNIKEPYILNVGTIEPRKNLITLLRAFTLFKDRFDSDISLVIVGGSGWKNKALATVLNNHPYKNAIVLTGFVDRNDMPAIYSQCSTFVYPSIYEGFGLPLIEAMACGAPCISANNSSLPEVGGDAALYFKTKDPISLSKTIYRVISNHKLQKELMFASKKQAEKFTWTKYVNEFLNVIDNKIPKK